MRNCRIPKSLAWLPLILALSLTGAFAKPVEPTGAEIAAVAVPTLTPTDRQVTLDKTIAELLSQHHYRQSKLDDRLSALILANYLDDLDFGRAYFLASDVAGFEKYRNTLDDALKKGDLQPAYDIFNVYLRRLAERTARIQALLQQDFRFDVNESLDVNRKNAPWAKTSAELDDFWRKRLKHELLTLLLSGKDRAAARELLVKRYDNRLRQAQQTASGDVFQLYMNAVAQAFDPHTAYFSPRNTENFNIQMRLSLEGIGCVLRMEEEMVTVVELVAGGPADLSRQIKAGDRIVAVAQGDNEPWLDVVGWRLDDVVERIRGQRGTVVRLKVLPGKAGATAAEKTIRLVRDTIKLEKQAAKSEIKTLRGPDGRELRIGVITIPTFYSDFEAARRRDPNYRSTTRDVRRLLDEMNGKVDGLVLDLRENGGGSLQEAVDLTGLFIGEGPVVQVRDASGGVEVEQDNEPGRAYDGPLAVLVDHASASASEIFAGAIQDYGRGLVVGDPTFGKGTVQTLVDLNRLTRAKDPQGQLKLTIAKFYRVSGSSTQHRGVRPDIAIPSAVDSEEVGESAQKNALPWDEIAAARYRGDRGVQTLAPELARRHQARIVGDPDYQAFLRDLEFTRQQRDKSTVSLLESQRRIERERVEAWQRERENRYRAAKDLPPLKAGDEIPEGKDSAIPDMALEESTRIVADLIVLSGSGNALVMSR
ncbi:MAG: carboxy terminal-processing peptidase [Candidatus Contendobacter sp.]|nr:carboxy terminal-processing peptidase [Candidatus Contendobacter sp.]MDG4559008.1 carboxy terminal-processing peptidase [Candidatus Contendobacter sp.]